MAGSVDFERFRGNLPTTTRRTTTKRRKNPTRNHNMPSDNNTPDNPASSGEDGLTLRQRMFAAAYHAEPNATRAAIAAGYSVATAQQAGSRLLKDARVRAELARLAGGERPEKTAEPAIPTPKPAAKKARGRPRKEKPAQPQQQQQPAQQQPQADLAPVTRRLLAQVGAADPGAMATTPTEEAFITEYLRNGMNATAAAVTVLGDGVAVAKATGWQILRRPRVVARIDSERRRLSAQHQMNRDQLLGEFLAIVRADPNELTQMRQVACGACWGGEQLGRWADPDPECATCAGEGDAVPWIADTRKLSPEALALYAGIKVTANGVQVLMHDKMAALQNIGRILGAYEQDNKQKQAPLTEAIAQFISQLHAEGAGRLKYSPPPVPLHAQKKVQH